MPIFCTDPWKKSDNIPKLVAAVAEMFFVYHRVGTGQILGAVLSDQSLKEKLSVD
jgi:hypothetical protein